MTFATAATLTAATPDEWVTAWRTYYAENIQDAAVLPAPGAVGVAARKKVKIAATTTTAARVTPASLTAPAATKTRS